MVQTNCHSSVGPVCPRIGPAQQFVSKENDDDEYDNDAGNKNTKNVNNKYDDDNDLIIMLVVKDIEERENFIIEAILYEKKAIVQDDLCNRTMK